MLKNLLLLSVLCAGLSGCSVTPAQANPVTAPPLVGHPAPVISFEGESFFLVNKQQKGSLRTYEFVRDSDQAETADMTLSYRVQAGQDLRTYEKAFLAGKDQAPREVHYRSPVRLVHTLLTSTDMAHEFRVMEWRMQRGSLLCCELLVRAPAKTCDTKKFSDQMSAGHRKWLKDLERFSAQAPALLGG